MSVGVSASQHPTENVDRHSTARVISFLLIFDLAYAINAMDRQILPILIKPIAGDLQLSTSQFGLVSTVFTLGMGLAAFPSGYAADRLGRKAMIQVGLIVFSLATALQGLALGFGDLTTYRILSGLGEGAQNAALYAAVGSYFRTRRSLAVGTLNASYGVGAFVGPVLGNYIFQASGSWRVPLFVFALAGLLVFITILIGIPKEVSDAPKILAIPQTDLDRKLFNRNVICCMIVASVAGFAIYGYLGLYPTFLQVERGFNSTQASLVSGMFGVGALASIPIGFIADRWDQKALNAIGLVGLMVVGTLTFAADLGLYADVVLTVLMGICFTGVLYTNTNTLMQKSVSPGRVASAVGLFVAALYVPASVAGLAFGLMETRWGWAIAGLVQMAIIPAFGLVAMLFMKPLHTPEEKAG